MIGKDPRLPSVATALDTAAVLELLRQHLRARGEEVALNAVEVQDIRYEPGRRCELLYRVKGEHPRTGKSVRQLIAGRVVPLGEEPVEPPAALLERYAALDPPLIRTPFIFFEQPRLELYSHPLDPAMPSLFDALDADALAAGLTRMWEARRTKVRSVRIEPLGYTPRSRAAFAYDVLAEAKRTREPEMRRLIGKMHAKKPAARLFAGAWALWSAANGRIGFAPPVGFLASLNLTFQERVAGERLGSLAGKPNFTRHIRTTARYSATLHRLQVPLATRRTPADEASVVHRWSSMLMAIRPDMATRIADLRDRLSRALETRVEIKGPVHGDFHHTNVLVDGDRVTIIDLDEMALGDPLLDVGRFIASLRIPALRTFGSADALADVREAYLREYLRCNSDDVRRVRLFEAATLFTAAASAFRIQRPGWFDEVELLVSEAERVFQSGVEGEPHALTPAAASSTHSFDALAWQRDPLYMRAALAADVERAYGAELTDVEIQKESADGERLYYRVSGSRDTGRWHADLVGSRSEKKGAGLLERVVALTTALEGNPDAPVLPRPVGYVRELGLLVFETVDGQSLASLLDAPDGQPAASRLGRALAAIHGASLPLNRARSLDSELEALRRQIAAVRKIRPELHERSADLLSEVTRRWRELPVAAAPTLRVVHPRHVLYHGDNVTLTRIDDVTLAHPFIDSADFLARLALAGVRQAQVPAAEEMTERFRDAYNATAPLSLAAAQPVEACALLRLACELAQKDRGSPVPDVLLRRVHAVLAA